MSPEDVTLCYQEFFKSNKRRLESQCETGDPKVAILDEQRQAGFRIRHVIVQLAFLICVSVILQQKNIATYI